jgi:chaperonin cofactor prefoldin|tara:strand:- start:125 stop:361 length:237 start_codon:yes stop_codon:yes gene_type:complete
VENRIERIESKIDDLQEAIVSLARVEERITTIFSRQTKIEEQVNSMDEKLSKIHPSVAFAERLFWIAVVAYFSFGDMI